ncbi:MAG: carbon monoxide dehydrogenase, partial [Nitrospirota bacterium]|nr:carbon monoxide dehydrogenase [Nitrospirota bacterium]
MAFVIALAGKGGTGKTSIAGLAVRYLMERKKKPVLAVDADSNSCLHEALGVDVHATIGHLREESLQTIRSGGERPGGMSMEQLFDYQVQQSIIETKG